MNQYETVFILNPVLSETQIEEAVKKYESLLTSNKCTIVHKEDWGLKKLAFTIQNKKSGFYVGFLKISTLTPYISASLFYTFKGYFVKEQLNIN